MLACVTDNRELRPAPPPRQVDTRLIVRCGVGLFAVAFVLLILLPWSREDADHRVWLWTALTGMVLGLLGLVLMKWQKAPTTDRAGESAHPQ